VTNGIIYTAENCAENGRFWDGTNCIECKNPKFWNNERKRCLECPAGYSYNSAKQNCIQCPTGFTFDSSKGTCVSTSSGSGSGSSIRFWVSIRVSFRHQVLDQHQHQDQHQVLGQHQVQVQVQVQMELQTQTQPQSQPEITVCCPDIGTSLIADANTAQQVKIMTSSKENVLSVKLEILIVAKFIHVFQTVGNLSLRSQHKLTVSYPISGETK
jgi:hypothetical protein